jgi:hypothetical protein
MRSGARTTHVVDVDPQRQGLYVPGTGQQAVPPAFPKSEEPDVVIVVNSAYEEDIRRPLSSPGISPELKYL